MGGIVRGELKSLLLLVPVIHQSSSKKTHVAKKKKKKCLEVNSIFSSRTDLLKFSGLCCILIKFLEKLQIMLVQNEKVLHTQKSVSVISKVSFRNSLYWCVFEKLFAICSKKKNSSVYGN